MSGRRGFEGGKERLSSEIRWSAFTVALASQFLDFQTITLLQGKSSSPAHPTVSSSFSGEKVLAQSLRYELTTTKHDG